MSTLDIELYRSMVNPPDLRQTSDTLAGAGGEIECYGKFRTTTKFKDQEYAIDFFVIKAATYWAEQMIQHWAFSNSTDIREP